MGKKSKRRQRNQQQQEQPSSLSSSQRVGPRESQRPRGNDDNDKDGKFRKGSEEIETKDNLRFEDPYADEIIKEDTILNNDDDEEEDCSMTDDGENGGDDGGGSSGDEESSNNKNKQKQRFLSSVAMNDAGEEDVELIQSWHPLMGRPSGNQEEELELEMDPAAYKMHHAIRPEWPCLSFDFIRDDLGEHRVKFPHELQAAIGTQAENPRDNRLTILRLSDLSKMGSPNDEEDILGDKYDENDDDSSDDSSEDEADFDLDPVLEHHSLPHYGGVNRVRVMPQNPHNIVATWSDAGRVNLYDVRGLRERFLDDTASRRGGGGRAPNRLKPASSAPDHRSNPLFFTHDGHETEGYAVDWSAIDRGSLATGDNDGKIHLWQPRDESASSYTVKPSYETSSEGEICSVEDIQWSPTEKTVLAAAESGGRVGIYDTRAPHRAMLRPKLHCGSSSGAAAVDANVLSWNRHVTNLLATGGDDGTLCVWDLRQFSSSSSSGQQGGGGKPDPLARFSCHKTPITSVEWHPTDESMLAISDEVGAYVYDLSVEEDTTTGGSGSHQVAVADIPPQLLFCHSGSTQFKELHWHPQISSCVMTTALTGFSVFIPSNL